MHKCILLIALLFSAEVLASSNNPPGQITDLTIGGNWIRVRTTAMTNGEQCASDSFFRLEFTDDPSKAMYSAILTAKATGESIFFLLSGCIGNYPRITHVYLS